MTPDAFMRFGGVSCGVSAYFLSDKDPPCTSGSIVRKILRWFLKARLAKDGMFNYVKFCDTIDTAFSVKGLEKSPRMRTRSCSVEGAVGLSRTSTGFRN